MTDGFDPDFVNEYELETWTRCAPEYLDGFAGMTRETLPMLMEATRMEAGHAVLDVGSGPGHICGALSRMGCSATGIDFSSAMVKVAEEKYPDARFYQGNAEELPFKDGSFDSAVSNFVVHHLARPEAVFREVSRTLKDDGKFAYAVFADPASQSSVAGFFQAVEKYHDVADLPHGPLFGVTDLDVHKKMLEAGGFRDPEFAFQPIVWKTETPQNVFSSFADWGNLAAMADDVREKIEEMTLESYEAYRVDGGYEFPHEVLIASAAKA